MVGMLNDIHVRAAARDSEAGTMNSRRKGHQYERDTAAWYRSLGYEARRGWQCRKGDDDPDVIVDGLPYWVECKRYASLGLVQRAWKQATEATAAQQLWRILGESPTTVDCAVLHVKADRGDDLVVISRETWGRLIGDAKA